MKIFVTFKRPILEKKKYISGKTGEIQIKSIVNSK